MEPDRCKITEYSGFPDYQTVPKLTNFYTYFVLLLPHLGYTTNK